MSPVNQLSLIQSRTLLAATKRDGVTLTPDARQRITNHAASLEGVAAPAPRRPVAVAGQTKPGQAKTAKERAAP